MVVGNSIDSRGILVLIPKSAEKLWWLYLKEGFQVVIVASDTNGEGAGRRAFENERKNRVIKKVAKSGTMTILDVELNVFPNLFVRG